MFVRPRFTTLFNQNIGVHFDTSSDRLLAEITTAIKVYAHGVEDFVNDSRNKDYSLNTQLSCEGGAGDSRWRTVKTNLAD
ncbi:unnamed protein product [Nesidiocoris tenuis]|uniref:Uncharacterized protein n=1 Tax=Nesidiocoris tenuis TaxID=355587 RepID=A0A6H5GRS0_9HEMI|nr:unnamed protein product [Nesidiocoris tenuis]